LRATAKYNLAGAIEREKLDRKFVDQKLRAKND